MEISAETSGVSVLIDSSDALREFTEKFTQSRAHSWIGHVEFVDWLDPLKLTERFCTSNNLSTIARQVCHMGAEDYTLLAAHIRLDGIDCIQTMGCAEYNGLWYNTDLSNNLSAVLGLSSYAEGLLPGWGDDVTDEDIQRLQNATPNAEQAWIRASWESSGLVGTHWKLIALNEGNCDVTGDETAISKDSVQSIWAELRFMRLGGAIIDLRYSPDLCAELAGGYANAKICMVWGEQSGQLNVANALITGSNQSLGDVTCARDGDTIIFTLSSGLQATFRRIP